MKIRVKNIITIGIIALTLISCSGELQKADYQVIPLPKNITENAAERPFILSKNVSITYPTSQPELLKEANFLTEFLNEILRILLFLNILFIITYFLLNIEDKNDRIYL